MENWLFKSSENILISVLVSLHIMNVYSLKFWLFENVFTTLLSQSYLSIADSFFLWYSYSSNVVWNFLSRKNIHSNNFCEEIITRDQQVNRFSSAGTSYVLECLMNEFEIHLYLKDTYSWNKDFLGKLIKRKMNLPSRCIYKKKNCFSKINRSWRWSAWKIDLPRKWIYHKDGFIWKMDLPQK